MRYWVPIIAFVIALSLSVGASAEDTASATVARAAIDRCLAETAPENHRDCIGAYSDGCMDRPGGETTIGMTDCVSTEAEAWDAILNENYQARLSEAETVDADRASFDASQPGSAAKSLKTARRAWIAYRDAECDRLFELYKDGTIRLPVTAGCMNDLTAERALALRSDGKVKLDVSYSDCGSAIE